MSLFFLWENLQNDCNKRLKMIMMRVSKNYFILQTIQKWVHHHNNVNNALCLSSLYLFWCKSNAIIDKVSNCSHVHEDQRQFAIMIVIHEDSIICICIVVKMRLTQFSFSLAYCCKRACNFSPSPFALRNSSTVLFVCSYWATGITAFNPAKYLSSVLCKSGTGTFGKSYKIR